MKKLVIITATLLLLLAAPKASADSIKVETYESGDILTAVIKAEDIATPVIGLAFDLYYNPSTLSYIDYYEGAFFEQGGEPIYLVTNGSDHKGGKIITGITLKRTDAMVDLSGTVIAIDFQILNKNQTELTFKNQVISTIEDGTRKNLEIDWVNAEISFQKTTTQPKQEIILASEPEEEIPELLQANIMSLPSPLLIPLLLPLPFLCYILFRLIKKRRGSRTIKTSGPGLGQPPPICAS